MQLSNKQWQLSDLCHLAKILWTLLELKMTLDIWILFLEINRISFFLFFFLAEGGNLSDFFWLKIWTRRCCFAKCSPFPRLSTQCLTYLELWRFFFSENVQMPNFSIFFYYFKPASLSPYICTRIHMHTGVTTKLRSFTVTRVVHHKNEFSN